MSRRLSPRVAISVGHRLLLGVAPALLAVVLVLTLSYYGEIGRQAPGYVVAGAAVLAVLSLLVTWFNTRHLTLRIRRLGGTADASPGTAASSAFERSAWRQDDLSRIEQELARLSAATSSAESALAEERALNARRVSELATVHGAAIRDTIAQLEDVRLPIHILLDAPFGELNENQEELLASARMAADNMDGALRRLMLIADVDREALALSRERVSLNDAVRSVLPMLRSAAHLRSAELRVHLDPSLPRVLADRSRLAEALALLGIEATRGVQTGGACNVTTRATEDEVALDIVPPLSAQSSERMLGERLIAAQGGRVEHHAEATTLVLPLVRRVR